LRAVVRRGHGDELDIRDGRYLLRQKEGQPAIQVRGVCRIKYIVFLAHNHYIFCCDCAGRVDRDAIEIDGVQCDVARVEVAVCYDPTLAAVCALRDLLDIGRGYGRGRAYEKENFVLADGVCIRRAA
jgi:hypothetical protein